MPIAPELTRWLVSAGLVPGRTGTFAGGDAADARALCRALQHAWLEQAARTRSARRAAAAAARARVLERLADRPGTWRSAAGDAVPHTVRHWFPQHAWWLSPELPARERVAVVSSRTPRMLDPAGPWLHGLRAALARIAERDALAVVADGTAACDLVRHGVRRAGQSLFSLVPCDLGVCPLATWAKRWLAWLATTDSEPSLTPPHAAAASVDAWGIPVEALPRPANTHEPAAIPERDRALVAWADEIIVLGVRPGGNVHRLLRRRLEEDRARVLLVDLPGLGHARTRSELERHGATSWIPPSEISGEARRSAAQRPVHTTHDVATAEAELRAENTPSLARGPGPLVPVSALGGPRRIAPPPPPAWDYLTHTTRACAGAWPGESLERHRDDLLDGRPASDHSAFAALVRIARERLLRASGRAIRGGYAVICFTAVPLDELPRLNVFRVHRGRWDFEPYGIVIRRLWLERRGARPVRYAAAADWAGIAELDRPFFQLARGGRRPGRGSAATGIDWTVEREWRHRGDLDLGELAAEDVMLFVPGVAEAAELARATAWPVTVLSAPQHAARGPVSSVFMDHAGEREG